jgi:hypothetical protein
VSKTKRTKGIVDKQALVVTTAHKGVFFGYGTPSNDKTIRLERARMCVYWSEDCKGVVGLAANGPTARCKVGPAAPFITLQDVTAVMEASDAAVSAWEKGFWT